VSARRALIRVAGDVAAAVRGFILVAALGFALLGGCQSPPTPTPTPPAPAVSRSPLPVPIPMAPPASAVGPHSVAWQASGPGSISLAYGTIAWQRTATMPEVFRVTSHATDSDLPYLSLVVSDVNTADGIVRCMITVDGRGEVASTGRGLATCAVNPTLHEGNQP